MRLGKQKEGKTHKKTTGSRAHLADVFLLAEVGGYLELNADVALTCGLWSIAQNQVVGRPCLPLLGVFFCKFRWVNGVGVASMWSRSDLETKRLEKD